MMKHQKSDFKKWVGLKTFQHPSVCVCVCTCDKFIFLDHVTGMTPKTKV